MEILKITPVFKEMIWGGNRLKEEFGYDIPSDKTGECWTVSAHPDGEGRIADGKYEGMLLSELWNSHRELFGNYPSDRFPMLVKLIDANADLSIQVHPDDAYAAEHEAGSYGKFECWYILDCKEDATIIIGHNAKTKQELREMIEQDRWSELIREIPIHKGDFFQINPGTVHAIKAGTLLLETQQSSDITYRLYDYDRLQNGKPRELHIEKSLDVIQVPYKPDSDAGVEAREDAGANACSYSGSASAGSGWFRKLYSCKYFNVWKAELTGEETLRQNYPFMIGTVLSGDFDIEGNEISHRHFVKGESFILPYGIGAFQLTGDAEIIFSSPYEK